MLFPTVRTFSHFLLYCLPIYNLYIDKYKKEDPQKSDESPVESKPAVCSDTEDKEKGTKKTTSDSENDESTEDVAVFIGADTECLMQDDDSNPGDKNEAVEESEMITA